MASPFTASAKVQRNMPKTVACGTIKYKPLGDGRHNHLSYISRHRRLLYTPTTSSSKRANHSLSSHSHIPLLNFSLPLGSLWAQATQLTPSLAICCISSSTDHSFDQSIRW